MCQTILSLDTYDRSMHNLKAMIPIKMRERERERERESVCVSGLDTSPPPVIGMEWGIDEVSVLN